MRGFIFGSLGALIVSFIELFLLCIIVRFVALKLPNANIKGIFTIVFILLLIGTWYFLLTGGSEKSSINSDIISEKTTANITHNINELKNNELITNFYENDIKTENKDISFSFYYRREDGGSLVSVYIVKYREASYAKNDVTEYEHYTHYENGEIELFLGNAQIRRTADTFYIGGSGRTIHTVLRADNYVFSITEFTQEGELTDLRTVDIINKLLD